MEKNVYEQIRELQESVTQLEGILQIGKVTSVSIGKRTAVVAWSDSKAPSASLKIIQQGTSWTPTVGEKVLCLQRKDGGGFILGVI